MKRIVLIEDNQDVLETTKEILELADYEVMTSNNGRDGVKLVKSKLPDLIICDIMMPELDGYGVLRILSKEPKTAGIPFIFLSAKTEKSEVRKGMNLGADDYITKPFKESELIEAVETRLRKFERLQKDFDDGLDGVDQVLNVVRGGKELQSLVLERKIKKYKKNEAIYREDDFANYLYHIVKGKVKCIKTDPNGKHFVNDLGSEKDFIGYLPLLADTDYNESAIAVEDTEVAVIPKQDFLDLIQKNRNVATKLIKFIAGKTEEKEKSLLLLAYASVRERVAHVLLKLKEDKARGDHTDNKINNSREDLAEMVGTAKESLIRTLSEFKKKVC